MHVISKKTIKEFSDSNAQAKEELSIWYQQVKAADWNDFNALRADFPSCDYIADNRYIFNIKGNHYRLIAMIFFGSRQVFIRGIYTHSQYDKLSKKDITFL